MQDMIPFTRQNRITMSVIFCLAVMRQTINFDDQSA